MIHDVRNLVNKAKDFPKKKSTTVTYVGPLDVLIVSLKETTQQK